jgi:hypothetical protein
VIKPTIHLNGTSAKDLYEQYSQMVDALRMAEYVMESNGPNGRDYYPQGNNVIYAAIEEHNDRVKRVHDVLAEVAALLAHVAEAL